VANSPLVKSCIGWEEHGFNPVPLCQSWTWTPFVPIGFWTLFCAEDFGPPFVPILDFGLFPLIILTSALNHVCLLKSTHLSYLTFIIRDPPVTPECNRQNECAQERQTRQMTSPTEHRSRAAAATATRMANPLPPPPQPFPALPAQPIAGK